MTRKELHKAIMEYWIACILKSEKHDRLINDLFDEITLGYGVEYELFGDWDETIEQLTNSQLRNFLTRIRESGILEMEA